MHILLVEDDKQLSSNIRRGLEQEKHVVDLAYNGEEAYDFTTMSDYDVIILDWMLPELNGPSLCRKLREENNNTPIIMLTAKSELEDKVEGLNCGADDYLTKPFAFAELLARIKAVARRPRSFSSDILRIDNLTFDVSKQLVTRADRTIDLSKKEYMLLEYLLRNQGQVLSKQQIMDNVWSLETDILENTVEVYINYLRKKIDKAFKNDQKLIHTVRGFGYKLDEEKDV